MSTAEKQNGIATVEDVRALADARSWAESERVVLPKSGFALILRKPTKFYWLLRRAEWPADFLTALDNDSEMSKQHFAFWLRERDKMAVQAFMQPKASSNPGFDAIDPRWLPEEDQKFILEYLGGQVRADGTPLETFSSGERKDAADGGAAGAEVREVADAGAPDGLVGLAG